jgi:hypothetical protein
MRKDRIDRLTNETDREFEQHRDITSDTVIQPSAETEVLDRDEADEQEMEELLEQRRCADVHPGGPGVGGD